MRSEPKHALLTGAVTFGARHWPRQTIVQHPLLLWARWIPKTKLDSCFWFATIEKQYSALFIYKVDHFATYLSLSRLSSCCLTQFNIYANLLSINCFPCFHAPYYVVQNCGNYSKISSIGSATLLLFVVAALADCRIVIISVSLYLRLFHRNWSAPVLMTRPAAPSALFDLEVLVMLDEYNSTTQWRSSLRLGGPDPRKESIISQV